MTDYNLPNYLPGIEPMYGVKQEAPSFVAGTNIIIPATLTDNGNPADYNQYILKAVMADSKGCTLFEGYLNYRLFINNGEVLINIPASITLGFSPGIYHINLIGQSKFDVNSITLLFSQTISINRIPGMQIPLIQPLGNPVTLVQKHADVIIPIEYFSTNG